MSLTCIQEPGCEGVCLFVEITRGSNNGYKCIVENNDNVTMPMAMIDDNNWSTRGGASESFKWNWLQEVSEVRQVLDPQNDFLALLLKLVILPEHVAECV